MISENEKNIKKEENTEINLSKKKVEKEDIPKSTTNKSGKNGG